MAAPPSPLDRLDDDATAQILLRLPPDEPECLFRAALVCKPWRNILCDPGFLRSYRAFHGAPPLLGIFRNLYTSEDDTPAPPCLTPTTAVPAFPHPGKGSDGRRCSLIQDCHHGRVLIDAPREGASDLLVWDPVTGDRHAVPEPEFHRWSLCASVICAAHGCDHLNCHGGPFRVAFVASPDHGKLISAGTYASETRSWSPETTCLYNRDYNILYLHTTRSTLIGDQVYFIVMWSNWSTGKGADIVRYEWCKNRLSLIDVPPSLVEDCWLYLIVMEDASLGLTHIKDSSLYLWSRKVNVEGVAEWMQCRVIDLDSAMPMAQPHCHWDTCVVGFAEGTNVIFVKSVVGLFASELKSGRVRKVDSGDQHGSKVFPYMSFYTPECSTLSLLARNQ